MRSCLVGLCVLVPCVYKFAATEQEGRSTVFLSVVHSQSECLDLCIKLGADVHMANKVCVSRVAFRSYCGDQRCVLSSHSWSMLLVCHALCQRGETPVFEAASTGKAEFVHQLVNLCADCNRPHRVCPPPPPPPIVVCCSTLCHLVPREGGAIDIGLCVWCVVCMVWRSGQGQPLACRCGGWLPFNSKDVDRVGS